MNLNKVILIGRVSQKPVMNQSKSGMQYARASLAVSRDSFGANKSEVTDFISIVAFGNNATFFSKYFNKGDLISIVGSLQVSQYTTKNGDVVSSSSVVIDNIKSLEPMNVTQARAMNNPNDSTFEGNYNAGGSTKIDQPRQPKGDINEPTFYEEEKNDEDSPWELDI